MVSGISRRSGLTLASGARRAYLGSTRERFEVEDAFEIVALAGRGRFGTVYKATGPSGPVALKRGADGWPTLQQDRDLARRLGRVEHAGVNLPVGWLREGDELWAILPWVDGADLTRVTEPMPQASALQAVAAVAEVLVHFKEQTVGSVKVPDLRPQHVRVGTGGEVSVVDLWHGRPDPEDEQHAEWLAPEVIKGRTAPLGDVYALGLLLHKLLGGHSLGVADTHLGRHAVQLSLALDGLSDARCTRT